ncbi:MAG: XRE family transcriptional regulator [Myxococcales bacterium]|nr:XRE family transcriptional regulator [Myxococcales bacterium]
MENNQDAKKGWLTAKLENWEFRRSYERELAAELFLTQVEQVLTEQKLSKTELAKRMKCSLANVSRAMRKSTNMTVATMVDMSLALNLRLKIELEPMVSGAVVTASETIKVTPCGFPQATVMMSAEVFSNAASSSNSETSATASGGGSPSWSLLCEESAFDVESLLPLPAEILVGKTTSWLNLNN